MESKWNLLLQVGVWSRNADSSLRCPDLVGSLSCRCEIASVTVYAAYRPLPSNWLAKDLWTEAQGQPGCNKGTRNNAKTIMIIQTQNMAAGGTEHLFNDGQDMYPSTVCNVTGHLSHNGVFPCVCCQGLCDHLYVNTVEKLWTEKAVRVNSLSLSQYIFSLSPAIFRLGKKTPGICFHSVQCW